MSKKMSSGNEPESVPYTEAATGSLNSNLLPEVIRAKGYGIFEQIGGGAFSKVYKARGKNKENKMVDMACKLIMLSEVPEEWKERSMKNELKVICKLNHVNIVSVFEVVKTRTRVFMFMELCPDTISAYITRTRKVLKEKQARFWFRQLMSAMEYVHAKEVAHRDLKLDNMLLDAKNNLKVADFGFASFVTNRDTGTPVLMNTECGTRAYMAPEIHSMPYDGQIADIWSCGVILFELVTLKKPFDDNLPEEKMIEIQKKQLFTFPDAKLLPLSDEVKDLIRLMLDPNVDKRPSATACLKHKWTTSSKG
ncbi:Testis-specific serine/threonine-protein kinase 1 [Halotydeus destructor]|nr:Testis-specific serine/threonine-protein kinase 1 [Halotydeus destructor]